MTDNNPATMHPIEHTREAKEKWYYPAQRTTKIAEGDWQRWLRSISSMSNREAMFMDVALFFFGLALPSLASAIIVVTGIPQKPIWDRIAFLVYFVLFIVGVAGGAICVAIDRKMKKIASSSVQAVLQDMKEVYERSARAEEITVSTDDIQLTDQVAPKPAWVIDDLPQRFEALRGIKLVVDSIPLGISREELLKQLRTDFKFRERFTQGFLRLFDLRNELIPYVEAEFVELVDGRLQPLYATQTGPSSFQEEELEELVAIAEQLRQMVTLTEKQLMAEYSETKGGVR